nr:class I SAM-dependent methyltransferase [Mycobacterium asiaticum]
MAKYWYPFVTQRDDEELFINYGYDEDPPMALPLEASDEANRYSIQLYHRTATQTDLSGKRVLEVGCGHGGGASYIMRTLHPASYTGLDLNPAGVAFCRERHILPGLDFVEGDAEDLPFPAESFDAVINIQSANLYPHFSRFLDEVARVLRPGGHFLYTDFRPKVRIPEWEEALSDAPMRLVSRTDIEKQVLRGLENTLKSQPTPRVPRLMRGAARKAAALQGSWLQSAVQSGDYAYRIYCFVKE